MKFRAAILTCLLATPAGAGGADGWRQLPAAAAQWEDAVLLAGENRVVLALDTAGISRLRGASPGKPLPATAADALVRFATEKTARLSISFPGAEAARDFTRFVRDDGSRTKCVWKLGAATLARTVLIDRPSGAVFIHLQSDHPGALTFRVTLETAPGAAARIEDRRQLVAAADGGLANRVWVLPFESDVEPDHGSILVRGEGEAMVIWAFGDAAAKEKLAGVFAKLAARHDPGREHPDLSRIWRGVLADQARPADSP
jgi:hypothetical protein